MRFLAFILAFSLMIFLSCKDKVEGNAIADFELKSNAVKEGSTLEIVQKSSNTNTYSWVIEGLNLSSRESIPVFFMDSAGSYIIELNVKGGNGSISSSNKSFDVLIDSIWRISNNSSKQWNVSSFVWKGKEQVGKTCSLDDIFTFDNNSSASDSFFYSEETDTCNSGAYDFEMPLKGTWELSSANHSLKMVVSSAGLSQTLNFVLDKLTVDSLKGTDLANNSSIELIRK